MRLPEPGLADKARRRVRPRAKLERAGHLDHLIGRRRLRIVRKVGHDDIWRPFGVRRAERAHAERLAGEDEEVRAQGVHVDDVTAALITAEREKFLDFCSPIAESTDFYVKKKGNAAIASIKDLAGKKCGVQAGSAMLSALPELEEMLKVTGGKMGEVVQYVSYPDAYQDLAIGRTDYVVNTQINLASLVKDRPAIFELGQAVSKKIYIAWAVKKGNTEVKAMLDTFLLGARKSGEMAALQQKWFGLTFDMPEQWSAA